MVLRGNEVSVLNFRCRKCNGIFNGDVGMITFPKNSQRPKFERDIVCPKCGVISMDEVFLTEIGQTQLTKIHIAALTKKR